MKTGFIHGYPNKPTKKRYSYHGFERDCLMQPNPGPFDEYPFKPPGPPWVLVGCWYPVGRWTFLINWAPLGFLNSSDPYNCPVGSPKKKKYYFMEIIYRKYPGYTGVALINTPKGSICDNYYTYEYGSYVSFTVDDWVWEASRKMYWHNQCGSGTRICIWRSATGERPGYDPTE